MFSDIEGVETYIDDFIIHGSTEEQHDQRLRQVLDRCRKVNLKLNLSKCEFRKTELHYLGHVISRNTIRPDRSKTNAICDMPEPQNKGDVRRILGMVTYLAKFCPNLSTVAAPLRDLTRKEVAWTWDAIHKDALRQVKDLVSSPAMLKLYDPHSEITLSVDASQYGLGACIMQDGVPVAYASRTLTYTHKRYAQVEKEMMAIEFGLHRFHQYIYGQTVTVETDHLPLLGVMRKPIADISSRLQRMRLKCLYYDFQLVYKPVRELIIADTLSRAQLPEQYITDNHEVEQVSELTELIIPTELQRQNIKTGKRFVHIAVGKKAHALKPTFNIQGADIECTDDVKLLGVTIDYRMNFDKHISNLCKKAARQINVLRRIGKYLPINCRKVIYQAFILSALKLLSSNLAFL